jgi:hypothetical protein
MRPPPPRYVLSDELDPAALRLGPQFNDITAVAASAFDTLLTGRCAGGGAPRGRRRARAGPG